MTNKEAYQAMIERIPVVCDGIEYKYIDAIKYKFMAREAVVRVFVEMIDNNSLVSAPVTAVERKGE